MDITKSGIVNIIIVTILSIPLDEEIFNFSADFLHAHPMISKLVTAKKIQTNKPTENKEDEKSKNLDIVTNTDNT
jgi:hypothetical protein